MIVKEIMTASICQVDPETTLAVASTVMAQRHVGSALVMEDEHLTGIVTERDVVRAMSNAHDAPLRPVAEWMSRDPVTVPSDTDVRNALDIMMQHGFRHLPVVDGGHPVGVLSMRDIARSLAQ